MSQGGRSSGTLHIHTRAAFQWVAYYLPAASPPSLSRASGDPFSSHSSPSLTLSAAAGLAPAARSVRRASRWPPSAAQ